MGQTRQPLKNLPRAVSTTIKETAGGALLRTQPANKMLNHSRSRTATACGPKPPGHNQKTHTTAHSSTHDQTEATQKKLPKRTDGRQNSNNPTILSPEKAPSAGQPEHKEASRTVEHSDSVENNQKQTAQKAAAALTINKKPDRTAQP